MTPHQIGLDIASILFGCLIWGAVLILIIIGLAAAYYAPGWSPLEVLR